MSLDKIMRSKYTSLGCALINSYFAVNSVMTGSWLWFIICGLFGAYCFRNFLEAR
jgi:hypothetical protein